MKGGAEKDVSLSLVHAGQHKDGEYTLIPIYNTEGGGVILRPHATPIKCAKGGDSGGHCKDDWCPSLRPVPDGVLPDAIAGLDYPGDGCGLSWRTSDIGAYLQRQAAWQRRYNRLEHNEFIIDARCVAERDPIVTQGMMHS